MKLAFCLFLATVCHLTGYQPVQADGASSFDKDVLSDCLETDGLDAPEVCFLRVTNACQASQQTDAPNPIVHQQRCDHRATAAWAEVSDGALAHMEETLHALFFDQIEAKTRSMRDSTCAQIDTQFAVLVSHSRFARCALLAEHFRAATVLSALKNTLECRYQGNAYQSGPCKEDNIEFADAKISTIAVELKSCLLREYALTEEWRFKSSLDCFAREKRPCPMSDRSACEIAATATVETEFRDALDAYYFDQLLNAGDRQEDVQREQDYSRLLLRHLTEKADLECQQYKEVEAYLGPLSSGDAQFVCNSYRSLRIAHFILGRFDHHAVYKYIRKNGDD